MLDFLKSWKGPIEIDGVLYNSFSEIQSELEVTDDTIILLRTNKESSADEAAKASSVIYSIEVRQYMTKPSTPDFDFMKKWNNDVPMPLRNMVGTVEKETRGMYFMKLKADTSFNTVQCCMRCGKPITNPVSQFFGMGPECGGHNYTNPFETDEELREAVSNYKKDVLSKITWEGWVIKSAITKMEEI